MVSSSIYDVASPLHDVPLGNVSDTIKLEDLSLGVFIITVVASVISTFAAIIFVWAFTSYKEYTTQNILISCLTAANGLTCVGIVLGAFHYKTDIPFGSGGTFCLLQSIICTYFDVVADIYTLYVEINICSQIAFCCLCMERVNAKIFYHSLAWGIPLIIVGVGWWRNALGQSQSLYGTWCWISDSLSHNEKWIWMVVTKQGWEIMVYLGTCFMFITIGYQRWCGKTKYSYPTSYNVSTNEVTNTANVGDERTQLMASSMSSQNKQYPSIPVNAVLVWVGIYFYLAKMWGTIRYSVHIYKLASNGDISKFIPVEKYFFIFAQSLGDSLQATITCCIFVFMDTELRKKVYTKWRRILCCRKVVGTDKDTNNEHT